MYFHVFTGRFRAKELHYLKFIGVVEDLFLQSFGYGLCSREVSNQSLPCKVFWIRMVFFGGAQRKGPSIVPSNGEVYLEINGF